MFLQKKLPKSKISCILYLIIVIFLFSPKYVGLGRSIDSVYLMGSKLRSAKIRTDPIVITKNDDFMNLGLIGNGTISNPFIIEDLILSNPTGNLIYIQDTTSFFYIKDIFLDGLRGNTTGIVFKNVINGFIINNTIMNSINGISLDNSFNIIISNNIIYSNSKYGIVLAHSDNNTIENNQISSSSYAGIGLSLFSNNNSIQTNDVDKSFIGIVFGDSMNNEVIGNNIHDSGRFGFNAWVTTSFNIIKFNNFIQNNEVEPWSDSQAWDAGSDNFFDFNYWDDFKSNDNNLDGIYDTPYEIDGSNEILNFDSHPIASPFQFIDHPISRPKIISPRRGEFLSGIVNITWAPSYDPLENPIVYSVYYSENGGESWTLLAFKIDDLFSLWDTTDLKIGSAYLVKICAIDSFGVYANETSDFLTIYSLQTEKWYDDQLEFSIFIIILGGVVGFIGGTFSPILSNWIQSKIDINKEKDKKKDSD